MFSFNTLSGVNDIVRFYVLNVGCDRQSVLSQTITPRLQIGPHLLVLISVKPNPLQQLTERFSFLTG